MNRILALVASALMLASPAFAGSTGPSHGMSGGHFGTMTPGFRTLPHSSVPMPSFGTLPPSIVPPPAFRTLPPVTVAPPTFKTLPPTITTQPLAPHR